MVVSVKGRTRPIFMFVAMTASCNDGVIQRHACHAYISYHLSHSVEWPAYRKYINVRIVLFAVSECNVTRIDYKTFPKVHGYQKPR